mmetsp:Transcript_21175/g.42151  ORF Transcript_21175/g.42151 Transcript_21175/m.42151 type:complete len:128 (+) Transcript_21175:468-851(+)
MKQITPFEHPNYKHHQYRKPNTRFERPYHLPCKMRIIELGRKSYDPSHAILESEERNDAEDISNYEYCLLGARRCLQRRDPCNVWETNKGVVNPWQPVSNFFQVTTNEFLGKNQSNGGTRKSISNQD